MLLLFKILNQRNEMSNHILSVFEKHLGKHQDLGSKLTNVKDLNHLTGILQTLDLSLKKCQTLLHDSSQVSQIVEQCSFLGETLFEKEFNLPFSSANFHVENIASMLCNNSEEEVLHYIEDKRSEISDLLDKILESMEEQESEQFSSFSNQGHFLRSAF